ncbi:hypothetical protein ABKV19_014303 [Rosa sericea]
MVVLRENKDLGVLMGRKWVLECACGGGLCLILTGTTDKNIGSQFYCCPSRRDAVVVYVYSSGAMRPTVWQLVVSFQACQTTKEAMWEVFHLSTCELVTSWKRRLEFSSAMQINVAFPGAFDIWSFNFYDRKMELRPELL